MKHALILAPFSQAELDRLRVRMRVSHESWLETSRLYDPEELAARVNGESVTHLIVEADFVFEDTLDQVRSLELVAICRNAVNHVDLEAATRQNIFVINAQGRNAVAVAELTVGLMLGLARHITEADAFIKRGSWLDPIEAYSQFRGTELAGKTAGIIALGTIGQMVARRLRSMDMNLVAYDPYTNPLFAIDIELVGLEELLAISDYVLVHAPSTPDTIGMIGRNQLALMKPFAFLVNASAPGVVDEEALTEALVKHLIAGAALDVFDGQPLPTSSKLRTLGNVLLTPHIGGATTETVDRHSRMIADDILRHLDGNRPERLVNGDVWDALRATEDKP